MADRMNGRTSPANGAQWVPLLLDPDGSLVITGGGSSGGATASEIGAAVNTLPAPSDFVLALTTAAASGYREVIPANATRGDTASFSHNSDTATLWDYEHTTLDASLQVGEPLEPRGVYVPRSQGRISVWSPVSGVTLRGGQM